MATQEESESLKALKEINEKLCNCTFGNLLTSCGIAVSQLHQILLTNALSKEVEQLATKQLNTIVQITKTLMSFISYDANNLGEGQQRPLRANRQLSRDKYKLKVDSEIVVCRICDEQIPVELLEEHTSSCIAAYHNENVINDVNQAMKDLRSLLAATYLTNVWPDTQKNALASSMPMEHLCLILHRAINTDPHVADAPEELNALVFEVENIVNLLDSQLIHIEALKIKKLIVEKKHSSLAFRKEREILRKTRLSGNAQTNINQATIADFDIIKRISSGAYARVFLVRKKKTGDIYALKVLPKSDISQKNQVKRVLAEKDILLQFNNPYIINFCMYILIYLCIYIYVFK